MRKNKSDYIGFNDQLYQTEAAMLQARIATRKRAGRVVTSDELWEWIKRRKPGWSELDREKVFQLVKL